MPPRRTGEDETLERAISDKAVATIHHREEEKEIEGGGRVEREKEREWRRERKEIFPCSLFL